MIIKAISIHQPWASLIASGVKKFETRSWSTRHRGPLLICASKYKLPPIEVRFLMLDLQTPSIGDVSEERFYYLPFGKAVCLVNLEACISTDLIHFDRRFKETDRPFGDFSPGRFAWRLRNVRTFEPFPVRGQQGLFNVEVPDSLMEER